jgi:hypothetical protein
MHVFKTYLLGFRYLNYFDSFVIFTILVTLIIFSIKTPLFLYLTLFI